MIMKKIYIIFTIIFIGCKLSAQNNTNNKHILRLVFINPGIEYEFSVSDKSKLTANIAYGLLPAYPNTTAEQPKNKLLFAPFFDVHYKMIYNKNRRETKNKSIAYNAGDFWGIKFTGRGKNYDNGVVRTDNIDFAVGPVWGIQRSVKKISFLFAVGPQYYFDTKGNSGFYPFMFEFNIAYILLAK
jgi:hypothetical protein